MENFNPKIAALKRAVETLEEAARMADSAIVSDATIRRFEYTFDLLWKCLRSILTDVHGIECYSPKTCFRETFSVGLCTEQETEILLAMTDDRNATAHTYSEEKAERIRKRIVGEFLPLIRKLAASIETCRP
jgi:nucleotidyltransferase substrate binding protein (TIGR01987 family)